MYSNKEIFEGIIRKDPTIISYLYNTNKPIITKWILKNSGAVDDSNDIFHEAFLIILRKINAEGETIELKCSFSTYFFSVCKHLWFQELRTRARYSLKEIEEFCNNISAESYDDIEDKKFRIYVKQLNQLESKCRELLLLHCKSKTLSEIMNIMGFINVQAVADKKKNCRKKLISNLLSCKEYKELQSEIFINN